MGNDIFEGYIAFLNPVYNLCLQCFSLFCFRSFPGYFRREMIRSKKRPAALSKISPAIAIKYVRLQFLVLSSPTDRTPKPSEEIKLLEAGLGKRTMTVADNSCHEEVI